MGRNCIFWHDAGAAAPAEVLDLDPNQQEQHRLKPKAKPKAKVNGCPAVLVGMVAAKLSEAEKVLQPTRAGTAMASRNPLQLH